MTKSTPGICCRGPMIGETPHCNNLRASRDKDAPQVKALSDPGKTIFGVATALGMRIRNASSSPWKTE